MYSFQINIIPKWQIKNEPNYFIGDNRKLFNYRTGKIIQMQVKGYTKGYYLSGKFYSLKKLRTLLEKININTCPF